MARRGILIGHLVLRFASVWGTKICRNLVQERASLGDLRQKSISTSLAARYRSRLWSLDTSGGLRAEEVRTFDMPLL